MRKKKWFKGKNHGSRSHKIPKMVEVNQCVECGNPLSNSQVDESEGTCPICGHESPGDRCEIRRVTIPKR